MCRMECRKYAQAPGCINQSMISHILFPEKKQNQTNERGKGKKKNKKTNKKKEEGKKGGETMTQGAKETYDLQEHIADKKANGNDLPFTGCSVNKSCGTRSMAGSSVLISFQSDRQILQNQPPPEWPGKHCWQNIKLMSHVSLPCPPGTAPRGSVVSAPAMSLCPARGKQSRIHHRWQPSRCPPPMWLFEVRAVPERLDVREEGLVRVVGEHVGGESSGSWSSCGCGRTRGT